MNQHLFVQLLSGNTKDTVSFSFDGELLTATRGISVAAALLENSKLTFRHTPVSGAPRAPYCMMGVCFECLLEIDGEQNRQSCMTRVAEGMHVSSQDGAKDLFESLVNPQQEEKTQ